MISHKIAALIVAITPNSYHFEQAFLDDFGKSWETNLVADLVRALKQ
jgi:hypothetical protein